MEKILKNVSALDYKEFRRRAMQACGWSVDQYANRLSGATKLTAAEEIVLQQIADNLKNETK